MEHRGKIHRNALVSVLGITCIVLVVEVSGGLLTGSLALLADAGHMLTDMAAIGLALLAQWFAQRPPTLKQTYGYYRVEVLAALANGLFLWLLVALIFWKAYQRFQDPPEVKSLLMLIVAGFGLLANLISGWLLRRFAGESLNLKGVFLHVVGDALGSLAALTAGLLMLFFQWYWSDPLLSLFIGVLILFYTARLLRAVICVLLEGTPPGVNLKKLEAALHQVSGVQEIHDLHVWSLTSGYNAMSVHVVLEDGLESGFRGELLSRLHHLVERDFPIRHITIQLEDRARNCRKSCIPPCREPHTS